MYQRMFMGWREKDIHHVVYRTFASQFTART